MQAGGLSRYEETSRRPRREAEDGEPTPPTTERPANPRRGGGRRRSRRRAGRRTRAAGMASRDQLTGRAHRRARRHAAGSPPTRRSRSAAGSWMPARTSCRCSPRTRRASSVRLPSPRWRPSRLGPSCSASDRPDPAYPPRPAGRPGGRRTGDRHADRRSTRPGISADLLAATLLATRAPVAGLPGDAHRDVGAPCRAGEHRASSRRRGVARPRAGDRVAWPAATWARAPRRARRSSSTRRPLLEQSLARPEPPSRSPDVRVLVTAGGTREPIDPVRFIANRSSGKQGHALADAARRVGADVTLVTTVDPPVRRRRRGRRSRDGRRDGATPCSPAQRSPTSSLWPPRSPTSARQSWPPRSCTRTDGVPDDRARPDARHPCRARATPASRPGARRLRGRDRRRGRQGSREARGKDVDLVVANDVGAEAGSASATRRML